MRTPSAKAKSSKSIHSDPLKPLITATVKLWHRHHLTYDQARYMAREVRKALKIERVKTHKRVVSRLSREEERRLIQQAYRDKSSRGLLIKTLLMTGAWVSEFSNLRELCTKSHLTVGNFFLPPLYKTRRRLFVQSSSLLLILMNTSLCHKQFDISVAEGEAEV